MTKLTQELPKGLIEGDDKRVRCSWCGDKQDYVAYHDNEWGVPVDDDNKLFEKICLEGFQAGLSWLTILRKRENFRAAFADFDFVKVAQFDDGDVERLVSDAGIVRHRGKINSTINNARRALELVEEFGSLGAYFWGFEPDANDRPQVADYESLTMITKSATSTNLSKDLKKRGWSFVGPTTIYAFMQAMGIVNDHIEGCERRDQIEFKREKFNFPRCKS